MTTWTQQIRYGIKKPVEEPLVIDTISSALLYRDFKQQFYIVISTFSSFFSHEKSEIKGKEALERHAH